MSIIKKYNLGASIIKWYSKSGDIEKVVEKLVSLGYTDITAYNVEAFIKNIQQKSESPALIISEYDADLVEKNMRYRINLQEKTVEALKQAEEHVYEIESHFKSPKIMKFKCSGCGKELEIKLDGMNEVSYHKTKDAAIRTKNDLIKHLRTTQIKFIELAKNQILRESIMDVIKEVDPDVADKIFQKIEQKQKELGVI